MRIPGHGRGCGARRRADLSPSTPPLRDEAPLRHYRYQATDETVEALRRLRGAWTGYRVEPEALVVDLADGAAVRIDVERAPIEPDFEAVRLRATVVGDPGALSAAGDLGAGRADVVLLAGATWIEGEARAVRGDDADAAGDGAGAVQFSGTLMQIGEAARAACVIFDAFVVATATGQGLLVRTGVRPGTVEVSDDRDAISAFLRARGYAGG